MNAECVIQARQGQNPPHMFPWPGQHHIAAVLPGQYLHAQQSAQGTAINEVKRRHVYDQAPAPRGQDCECCRNICRIHSVQFPAQSRDQVAIAHTGMKLHAYHRRRPLPRQSGKVWTQRSWDLP